MIRTVADPGAAVLLIRLETVQQLNLNISTDKRPQLRSPWSSEPYQAFGTTNARVCIENGPKRWISLVVIDCEQPWDMLLGNAHLNQMNIQLMTPAMVRQLQRKGRPVPTEGDTVAIDEELYTEQTEATAEATEAEVGSTSHDEVPTMPTDDDYAELGEVDLIATSDSGSDVVPELSTDREIQELADVTTIRLQRLRTKIGLPADFFVNSQGNDFFENDNLYLSISRASVKERIKHQLTDPADEERLLDKLIDMGASTLREYPSGCPPPAALKLIKPPMHEGAQLMFTVMLIGCIRGTHLGHSSQWGI
ncbi:hypothetical protein COEREDRAFT_12787 [Coemansia reversa NRRL 1564]|uniref:Uncharacterized protein n=1 Tax=Coemansia reversa (strain ATCC 12441 / NRRL 1564) TaxID=763665 RepID=A0A2G5B0B9_COERN|nr:hypothetical protein COEREDRAFT_12787 [Coemansia reversa NRRL 1564]|eukprot:PIA12471.1 hypothetical protein COEREDRAFT_12787 [Coemansia reversa NRRL 1564]